MILFRKFVFLNLLCFWISVLNLTAVDFNNTQADPSIIKGALPWDFIQNRNGVLYVPNAEFPFNGFVKKEFENKQVNIMARVSSGKLEHISRWRENGIPIFSVGITAGSFNLLDIPTGPDGFNDEVFDGVVKFWFVNGQIMLESTYDKGVRHGVTRTWYENGNQKVEESFQNGLKNGNAKSWFESGQKWMDYTHWEDKRDGPLVWWYENGQKRQEGNYKGGMRFGKWSYYQEDGKLLYRKIFRDGRAISTEYGNDETEK